jgi:hypothetical protein
MPGTTIPDSWSVVVDKFLLLGGLGAVTLEILD